jgi:hypothetical protein
MSKSEINSNTKCLNDIHDTINRVPSFDSLEFSSFGSVSNFDIRVSVFLSIVSLT